MPTDSSKLGDQVSKKTDLFIYYNLEKKQKPKTEPIGQ